MQTLRLPILVAQDPSGQYTACLVEGDETAVGRTRALAIQQLQEFLAWQVESTGLEIDADFLEPELVLFKVLVRPEYEHEEQIFPCTESIPLRVYCVHGRQKGGLLVASIPLLGVRFYYYEAGSLRDLVTRYVQQSLRAVTPRQLSRCQVWSDASLDRVVIRLNRKERRQISEPPLPVLSAIAEPLGHPSLRKQYGRAWERERDVADLASRLLAGGTNVLLVGESGCGKTTVLVEAIKAVERELAQRQKRKRNDEEHDEPQTRHRFRQTSAGRLISGMKYLGQWEERCEEMIAELRSISGVLCVENLLDLVRTGGRDPASSVGAFLQTYVQRGELRLIAEATPTELDACRRLLPGFADLLQPMALPSLTRQQAIGVLDRLAAFAQQNRHVTFERGTSELIDRLFRRFQPYQAFPGKVVGFVSDLSEQAGQRLRSKSRHQPPALSLTEPTTPAAGRPTPEAVVTADDVLKLFVKRTGLPELFLRDEFPLEFNDVLATFERQIIGQPSACDAATRLVMTFKAGMNDPQRPVGVLLFCGPTGVGKTELAKALARYFFGHGEQSDRMIRLDMSEYAGYGAAERLVGTPSGEPSELIQKVRAQPFSVVLFDEIEKAAPDVFDMLLSLFDEGRLTDRYGRTTDFRSAILILTSNLGSQKQESIGFGGRTGGDFDVEVQAFFRPEFYNRLDGIVTFQPLGRATILAITRKELEEIGRREGLVRNRLRLTWTDAALDRLATEGCDPRYGARPLQRTLERRIVAPLSRYLLAQPALRETVIQIELVGDEFRFQARSG